MAFKLHLIFVNLNYIEDHLVIIKIINTITRSNLYNFIAKFNSS